MTGTEPPEECATCGGDVRYVRSEIIRGDVVHHFRCKGRCRGGGHRSENGVTGGPVFESRLGSSVAGPEIEDRRLGRDASLAGFEEVPYR